MIKKKAYNIAIVGATGVVGELILKVLVERNFPIAHLKLLASKKSVGKKLSYNNKEVIVEELSTNSFSDIDIAFFAAGGDISRKYAKVAADAGAIVIDNSSAFRMDDSVPLIIPEVNPEDIRQHKGIIANPNCTTIIMLLALKPLYNYSKITKVIVSSYQSASGAGAAGMKELLDQAKNWVNDKPIKIEKFAHQLLFNVIPHVDSFTDNGYTKEEMKMYNETKKILHDNNIKVSATCVRVPVMSAHSESITITTENIITPSKARELLANAPGIILYDNPDNNLYPMPLIATGSDMVYAGRIRKDLTDANALSIWVCGDQIRKGAATNAVQIAQLLIG